MSRTFPHLLKVKTELGWKLDFLPCSEIPGCALCKSGCYLAPPSLCIAGWPSRVCTSRGGVCPGSAGLSRAALCPHQGWDPRFLEKKDCFRNHSLMKLQLRTSPGERGAHLASAAPPRASRDPWSPAEQGHAYPRQLKPISIFQAFIAMRNSRRREEATSQYDSLIP